MQMGKKKLHETINVQLFFTCFSILIDAYNFIPQLLLVVKANEWGYYE